MENQGFVKLYRKIVDWEWYDSLPEFKLFIHLLLKANHDDQNWHGEVVKRGSCVTSLASLSVETGLTIQQVRTAMKHLKSTQEITSIGRSKNTLVIVLNYNLYQDNNTMTNNQLTINQQSTNNQLTINQQSTNNQLTTNKNEKNVKNDKNINILSSSQLPFSEIIDYLNEKANTKYKHSAKSTKEKIVARWNEGYRLDDFKKVIDIKCEEWLGTSMEQYLRPETLFGTKFESYLNQKPKPQMKSRNVIKEIPLPEWFYQKEDETVEVDEEEIQNMLNELGINE